MKEIGIGIQRLQHNIVDLFPGSTIQTDEAFKVDGRTQTHMKTKKGKHGKRQIYIPTSFRIFLSIPYITNSGSMDGKYCRLTEIIQI